MGAVFLVPLYCQSVLGIDPIHTGTLMLPFALALLVASPLAGILSDKVGGKYVLLAGMIVLALSDLLMARFRVKREGHRAHAAVRRHGARHGHVDDAPDQSHPLRGVRGKGGGASGVLSTMRQVGAVMGVAVFSVVLQASMAGSIGVHAREVPHFPPAAQRVLVGYVAGGGLYGVPDGGENGLQAQLARVMKPSAAPGAPGAQSPQAPQAPTPAQQAQAAQEMKEMGAGIDLALKRSFTDSINVTFLMAALIGAGAVVVAFFIEGKRRVRRGARQLASVAGAEEEQMAVGE